MSGDGATGSTSRPADDERALLAAPAAPTTVTASITRLARDREPAAERDDLAVETPVALRFNDRNHVVMMASPADLVDFAYGFALSEGIVTDVREIEAVVASPRPEGVSLSIRIPTARAQALAARERNLAGRTGCGVCGVSEIAAVLRPLPRIESGARVSAAAIDRAVLALPALQTRNHPCGALHAAAFADRDGTVRLVREDVGRHNALDKLIGALTRASIDAATGFIVVTSRCSMEMVQKAASCGCAVLVAVSAPTALAVELAEQAGLTVSGLARGAGCNLYSHPERIDTAEAGPARLD